MTPDSSPMPADSPADRPVDVGAAASAPGDAAAGGDGRLSDVGDIIQRLHAPLPANPVTRARLRVEQEVPPARRGPGWDRHWRELEAYVESVAEWQTDEGGDPDR